MSTIDSFKCNCKIFVFVVFFLTVLLMMVHVYNAVCVTRLLLMTVGI